MREAIPYTEALAAGIRSARAVARLTQHDVAERMHALGYETWYSQTVGATESGHRPLRCGEALALAVALETSPDAVFYPPVFTPVRLAGGFEVATPAPRGAHYPGQESPWDGNKLRDLQ